MSLAENRVLASEECRLYLHVRLHGLKVATQLADLTLILRHDLSMVLLVAHLSKSRT